MAHSHQRHRDKNRKRVAHVLESAGYGRGGCAMPKKKAGGSVMHRGHARGNDSEVDLHADGEKGRHRYKKGGKVQINVVNIHHHPKDATLGPAAGAGMMAAPPPAMPPNAAPLAGAAPMAGARPFRRGGRTANDYGPSEAVPEDISEYHAARPRKNQGGPAGSFGAATGMSRKAEFEKLKGKG
jgi:hypothetical protein